MPSFVGASRRPVLAVALAAAVQVCAQPEPSPLSVLQAPLPGPHLMASPEVRGLVIAQRSGGGKADQPSLDAGSGFPSNDAREVIVSGGGEPLLRVWDDEGAIRLRPLDRRLADCILQLQSEEVVWVDPTTPSAADIRSFGLDLAARWKVLGWLWAGAGAYFTPGNPLHVRATLALAF